MTMRSIPPASSHFAERPVPAPPPTIGWPLAIMPRNFSIMSLRAILGMGSAPVVNEVEEGLYQRRREARIVQVVGQPDDAAAVVLPDGGFERLEERGVGRRVVERLARHIQQRNAAFGDQEPHRTVHAVQLLADPAPHALVLGGGGPHQGDLWVVDVEIA